MIIIKNFGRDREVINTSVYDVERGRQAHTHITHTKFANPNKVAKRIKYNVENHRLPRNSKFVKKYVGLQAFERFIVSHIRVCPKGKYKSKLIHYLEVHTDKHKGYYNVPKGFLK